MAARWPWSGLLFYIALTGGLMLSALLLSALLLSSRAEASPHPAKAQPDASAEPLLWRVQTTGSQHSVYLFGSLHFGDDSFFPLPDKVVSAYQSSDLLAVELDVNQLEPQTLHSTLERIGYYPSGVQLSERIAPTLWQELARASRRLGLSEATVVQLRPWLAALQLVNLQVAHSEYEAGQGVDRYFLDLASKDDKTIQPLETFEQQLALFAGMSEAEQSTFLEHTLKDLEVTGPQLQRMAQAWREGSRSGLESVILGAFAGDDPFRQHFYQRVFKTRNKAMLDAVQSYLDNDQRVFLVVGIGHLIGPDGLVDGLRRAGYTVDRL